jgi:hypothetical protein
LWSRTTGVLAAVAAASAALLAPAPTGAQQQGEELPLTIAQLQYDGGGDWYANPSSLPNLAAAIHDRTGVPIWLGPRVDIRLTDPRLRDFPYIYITGHGNIKLTDEEVLILREYLLAGGFLHADDNYGLNESFRREIKRVFPEKELVELPPDHPLYHIFYDFPKGIPKVHEHDGKPPQGFAVFDNGRMLVYYSYESDLGDGWEDPDVHKDPPEIREAALKMGVNLFLYVLSQQTQ